MSVGTMENNVFPNRAALPPKNLNGPAMPSNLFGTMSFVSVTPCSGRHSSS